MKCAIMQPTYLPWTGYFSLLASVDVFVFFDDVQFSKGSWQQRNRIMVNGHEQFLTVPVLKKRKSKQLMNEVVIDDQKPWRKKHLLTLKQTYSKHSFGNEILSLIEESLQSKCSLLVDLNIEIIKKIAGYLKVAPRFIKSSELPVQGKRSEYVIKICEYLQTDTYVSPIGAKEYIEEDGLFVKSDIRLIYHDFKLEPYHQKGANLFQPYLSIVDMIANIGFEGVTQHLVEVLK